jgi:predicted O-methyltransferase YrrM
MLPLLEQILSSRQVQAPDGSLKPLHGETQREQCLLLQQLVETIRPMRSVEVGLAYGISTLAICEKLPAGAKHTVCDPYQSDWNDIGLHNVRRAGFESLVDFHRAPAHRVLSDLERNETRLDFAYLDGGKMFDLVLVNTFFVTRMLRVGGLMVLDDADFPALRRICQFLETLPCYRISHTWAGHPRKASRPALARAVGALPGGKAILHPDHQTTGSVLDGHPHCVVFEKIATDDRP